MAKITKHKETAKFIRGARGQLRMTQQALADTLGIGRYNIAKYEIGMNTPPGDIVLKIIQLVEDRGRGAEKNLNVRL